MLYCFIVIKKYLLLEKGLNFAVTSDAIPHSEFAASAEKYLLIKKRIGIGYKNYGKQCPGLEFRLIPKLISWAGLKPKKLKKKTSLG